MLYSYLKLIHLIAVIIFLGNIFTGFFWMHIAMKTKDLNIISHSIKGVIRSDRLFTIPGVILITIGGIMTAIYGHIPILRTGWILWSLILFSISGIVFSWKLGPLQKKLYTYTLHREAGNNFNWSSFTKMYVEWKTWGWLALTTPFSALAMMTLKIPQ